MVSFDEVKLLIGEVLHLGDRVHQVDSFTPLLGSIPEFDSMAVVSVITAIEEQFGIIVEDDEISGETFATVGNLFNFIRHKVAE